MYANSFNHNTILQDSALEHSSKLHPKGRPGRVNVATVSRFEGWREQSFAVSDLPDVMKSLAGQPDVYISQQRFHGWRKVSRLRELGAMYCDVDFYSIPEYQEVHPLGVLEDVLIHLERQRMPAPTLAIASGRGLYLLWLHYAVPRGALPRWNAAQKVIVETLRPFGADPLVKDAARVLRLPGTTNSKTGFTVEQIAPDGDIWDFDTLCDEILPIERGELRDLRTRRALRRPQKPTERSKESIHRWNQGTLWEARLGDVQRLRELRWFGEPMPDFRDRWLFIAGVGMSYICITGALVREIVALAKEVGGWSDNRVKHKLQPVLERARMHQMGHKVEYQGVPLDPRYRFRNETIIDWLEITPDEERQMTTIISSDERRRRDRDRKEAARRQAGMISRDEYRAASERRKLQAAELRARGLTQRQIADTLGCSQQEVSRLTKAIDKGIQQSVPLYVALPGGTPHSKSGYGGFEVGMGDDLPEAPEEEKIVRRVAPVKKEDDDFGREFRELDRIAV